MFETIHEAIQPKLIFEHRGGNEQISPRKQLLLFLCYMANNETFRELGQYFGVGKSTAHVCIARVLEAFCEIFLDVCIQILVGIRCILFFHRVHWFFSIFFPSVISKYLYMIYNIFKLVLLHVPAQRVHFIIHDLFMNKIGINEMKKPHWYNTSLRYNVPLDFYIDKTKVSVLN